MTKKNYERPLVYKMEGRVSGKAGPEGRIRQMGAIDGHGPEDLLWEYGSPLFVLSEKTIRRNYQRLHQAFATRLPRVQLAWSYKTNYLDAVCRVFHQEGAWAEVVSGFEFEKALHNGVPGDKIIFNGPDKIREELRKAIACRSLIHIDHFDELYTLNELAAETGQRPQVAIRVNMDTGIYPLWDRFGFNYENGQAWDALVRIMRTGKMDLLGLHCHIGTFMLSAQAYAIAAEKLTALAVQLKEKFSHTIRYIDLGGGFASKNTLKGSYLNGADMSPGFDEYAEAISKVLLNGPFSNEEFPLLILETGRALIDDAGYLLGTVIANKRSATGRRNLVVDFGVNTLFTAFWYDHALLPVQSKSTYTEECTVYGPLCMNIDVIRERISLPLMKPGDRIAALHTGAYNMTQWMQFITLRPNIVMIDTRSEVHLIRKKETLETITGNELLPEFLTDINL